MNSQLMIGVLLITAGILLAVVAYWVISSGGSSKEPESTGEENGGEEPQVVGAETSEQVPLHMDEEEIPTDIPGPPDEMVSAMEENELEIDDIITLEDVAAADLQSGAVSASLDLGETEDDPINQTDMQPQVGPRISIASLLRDELTGELIVKVGNTEYKNPDELRDSTDWSRVEYAASDLQTWIAKEKRDQPTVEREVDAAEPKPMSMIEQINAILQEKIESAGRSDLGVRLLESPSGAARVLIGVQSYDLADVPDDDVRQLIQEAVAVWEADQ